VEAKVNVKTKVSVIIPVYNVAPFLKRCLDSVINQTLKEIEIICINDESPDSSLEILKQYAKFDKRIKIINNKKNQGVSASRNKAIKVANGEYLSFVDGDDSISNNFLEKLYSVAIKTNVDIVKGKKRMIAPCGEESYSTTNELISESGIFAFVCEFWSAIYKRELFQDERIRFPEGIVIAEDDVFLNRLMLKNASVTCINDAYYIYYRRKNSVTEYISIQKIKLKSRSFQTMIDEINDAYEKKVITDESYDILFQAKLFSVFFIYHCNEAKGYKEECAKLMINIYNQCLRYQTLDYKISAYYPLVFDFLKNRDVDALTNFFIKYDSYNKIIGANFRKRTQLKD